MRETGSDPYRDSCSDSTGVEAARAELPPCAGIDHQTGTNRKGCGVCGPFGDGMRAAFDAAEIQTHPPFAPIVHPASTSTDPPPFLSPPPLPTC